MPQTKVIGLVLEGIRDADNIRRVAAKAALLGKPIVVLKIGRSEKGRQSVLAHTSALAGSDSVHDAFFKQYGWIRIYDLDQLLTTMAAFVRGDLPKGRRLAVVGFSGGTTSLSADLCEEMRLDLPSLTGRDCGKAQSRICAAFSRRRTRSIWAGRILGGRRACGAVSASWAKRDDFDMAVLVSARGEETYVPVLEAGAKAAQSKRMAFAHVLSVSGPVAESLKNKARGDERPVAAGYSAGISKYSTSDRILGIQEPLAVGQILPPRKEASAARAAEMFKGKTILGERDAKELLSIYGIPVTPKEQPVT